MHARDALRTEEIEMATLDDFAIQNICLVKMDVEENEQNVVQGACHALARSNLPPLLLECNDPQAQAGLFGLIESLGYGVLQISGVSNMYLATRLAVSG